MHSHPTMRPFTPTKAAQVPAPAGGPPLSVGSAPMTPNPALAGWRRADGPAPTPEAAPLPSKVAPTPVAYDGGSFLSHKGNVVPDGNCDGCQPGCACGVNCCGGGLCPNNRWYVSAEYLLWWFKGQSVPPLVTSGSLGDTIPGALGAAGTEILFGGRDMENGAHSGGRIM